MSYFKTRYVRCILRDTFSSTYWGRKINWHDLAFFDPVMYESLRQLILDAEKSDSTSMFQALDLTFSVESGAEEVCISLCLKKNSK